MRHFPSARSSPGGVSPIDPANSGVVFVPGDNQVERTSTEELVFLPAQAEVVGWCEAVPLEWPTEPGILNRAFAHRQAFFFEWSKVDVGACHQRRLLQSPGSSSLLSSAGRLQPCTSSSPKAQPRSSNSSRTWIRRRQPPAPEALRVMRASCGPRPAGLPLRMPDSSRLRGCAALRISSVRLRRPTWWRRVATLRE